MKGYFKYFDVLSYLDLLVSNDITFMTSFYHHLNHEIMIIQTLINSSILDDREKNQNWHEAQEVTDPYVCNLEGVRVV